MTLLTVPASLGKNLLLVQGLRLQERRTEKQHLVAKEG